VLVLGFVLLVLGTALIVPSGRAPGASAHRIVRLNTMSIDATPGHRQTAPPGWRRRLIEVALALALIALGLWCMSVGWPEGR
jgi:hypothetical protein